MKLNINFLRNAKKNCDPLQASRWASWISFSPCAFRGLSCVASQGQNPCYRALVSWFLLLTFIFLFLFWVVSSVSLLLVVWAFRFVVLQLRVARANKSSCALLRACCEGLRDFSFGVCLEIYANHADWQLYRALKVREISDHFLEAERAVPVLSVLFYHFILEILCSKRAMKRFFKNSFGKR